MNFNPICLWNIFSISIIHFHIFIATLSYTFVTTYLNYITFFVSTNLHSFSLLYSQFKRIPNLCNSNNNEKNNFAKTKFHRKKCKYRTRGDRIKNDIISRLFIFFIWFIKTKLIKLERQHIHTNVVCSCAHKIARKYCLYIIYCCYTNRVVRITNFSLHLFWV